MPKKGKKIAARQARLRKDRRKTHHDGSGVHTKSTAAKETSNPATEKSAAKTVIEDSIAPSQVTDSSSQSAQSPVDSHTGRNPQTSGSQPHLRRVRSNIDINVFVRKEIVRISTISCVVIGVLIVLTFIL